MKSRVDTRDSFWGLQKEISLYFILQREDKKGKKLNLLKKQLNKMLRILDESRWADYGHWTTLLRHSNTCLRWAQLEAHQFRNLCTCTFIYSRTGITPRWISSVKECMILLNLRIKIDSIWNQILIMKGGWMQYMNTVTTINKLNTRSREKSFVVYKIW